MQTILLQFDTDPLPSSFDRVVAVDAGVDEVFAYGGVTPENVAPLVHGAIFTRGPSDLKQTAIFIGGSDAAAGDALFESVQSVFFGPMRVSVMMDSNGCNTTAAAAVRAAAKHLDVSQCTVLVLGGTGPVGRRAAQILAMEGAAVRVASRSRDRAEAACSAISERLPHGGELTPCSTTDGVRPLLEGASVVISAGAAGVQLLTAADRRNAADLRVAIDLNAVPPAGIEGIDATARADEQHGVVCYGAIGVGGGKMKLHKAALKRLFTANDLTLDTAEIYRIASEQ